MGVTLDRRRALGAIGALAVAGRVGAQAHGDTRVKVVGYLSNGARPEVLAERLAERGRGLGRNLRIEVRMTAQDDQRLEANARELLAARPEVLVAWGARNVKVLAKLTSTIPIVCGGTADPVGIGFARSLRHPGTNITGLSLGIPEMAPILVGLMVAARPGLQRVATLITGGGDAIAGWASVLKSIERVARERDLAWKPELIHSARDLDRVLAGLDPRTSIAYVVELPKSIALPEAVAALIRKRMPSATSGAKEARAGLLMHYSINHSDEAGRVAAIIDALLRGANPAEVPWELPDRTMFVLNRRTAREIGIEFPPELLARATEIVD